MHATHNVAAGKSHQPLGRDWVTATLAQAVAADGKPFESVFQLDNALPQSIGHSGLVLVIRSQSGGVDIIAQQIIPAQPSRRGVDPIKLFKSLRR